MKYKEFLNMKNGYTLEILPEHAGDDEESGLIEVPEGAEALRSTLHGDVFYKKNIGELPLPFSFAYIGDESWLGTSTNPYDERDTFFKCTLWQRHTQPEELPFIDDEVQSLNDQYAEIEQVRQDMINHPSHYADSAVECIDAMEAMMTPEQFIGYLRGNLFKYQWRYEKKNGIEDLKKAQWYLEKLTVKIAEKNAPF